MARWHSCIVFDSGPQARRLWQFSAAGDKFTLQKEETKLLDEPLPERLVVKDWPALFQPRLNVAWLPPEHVFLRVVQLPRSEPEESQSMIELQLEKLSPLPPAQVVWSFETLGPADGELQTVIVCIVPRQHVEEFLGKLEAQQYLADRLELPFLDQLRATELNEDGVWAFPGLGADGSSCMVAWWFGGSLQNLGLVRLPPSEDQWRVLQEHLTRISWAAEMEGWLNGTPRYHVVATPEVAEAWKAAFPEECPKVVIPPTPPAQLAALTARRAVHDTKKINLLPPEFAARYRQKLVDRVWMRALAASVLLYIAGAAIYLLWAQFARWQYTNVQSELASLGESYTNTLKLKAEVRVLQDQIDLQFAALESWKAVAENLPAELTLDSLSFERGAKLTVSGTASSGDYEKVLAFNEALAQASYKGSPLFTSIKPPNRNPRPGGQISWIFSCDLARSRAP